MMMMMNMMMVVMIIMMTAYQHKKPQLFFLSDSKNLVYDYHSTIFGVKKGCGSFFLCGRLGRIDMKIMMLIMMTVNVDNDDERGKRESALSAQFRCKHAAITHPHNKVIMMAKTKTMMTMMMLMMIIMMII